MHTEMSNLSHAKIPSNGKFCTLAVDLARDNYLTLYG